MDLIEKNLLKEIASLHEIPTGAYNIRKNGESAGRNSTEHIQITQKTDAPEKTGKPVPTLVIPNKPTVKPSSKRGDCGR